jgi:hypothetical protein
LLTSHPDAVIGQSSLPLFLQRLIEMLNTKPIPHLMSFTVLSFFALSAQWPVPRWLVLLTLSLYGGATEILQGLVPLRHPSWLDWLCDIGGVIAGFVLFMACVGLIRLLYGPERSQPPVSA